MKKTSSTDRFSSLANLMESPSSPRRGRMSIFRPRRRFRYTPGNSDSTKLKVLELSSYFHCPPGKMVEGNILAFIGDKTQYGSQQGRCISFSFLHRQPYAYTYTDLKTHLMIFSISVVVRVDRAESEQFCLFRLLDSSS